MVCDNQRRVNQLTSPEQPQELTAIGEMRGKKVKYRRRTHKPCKVVAQAVNRHFSADSRVYSRRTPTSRTINHLSLAAPTVPVDLLIAFKIYLKKQSSSQGKQRVIVGQMLRRCLAVRIAA